MQLYNCVTQRVMPRTMQPAAISRPHGRRFGSYIAVGTYVGCIPERMSTCEASQRRVILSESWNTCGEGAAPA